MPQDVRTSIEEYLLSNPEARELLGMAHDALANSDGAQKGRDIPTGLRIDQLSTRREQSQTRLDRAAERIDRAAEKIEKAKAPTWPYAMLLPAILLFAVSVFTVLDRPEIRTVSEHLTELWKPVISSDANTLRWPEVMGAERYAVVVFSPEQNEITNVVSTLSASVTNLQSVAWVYEDPDSEAVSVWVIAMDNQGQFLRSSGAVVLART